MTGPSGSRPAPNPDQAREELREGLFFSRELVRQSRVLIELSECDSAPPIDEADRGPAN